MAKKKAPAARKRSSPGKPRTHKAAPATVRLSAAVEKDLVVQVEAFARVRRTTVAALVAEGLRKVIGAEKVPVLPPGDMQPATPADAGAWGQLLAWMEEQQATLTEIRDQLGDVAASLPNDAPGAVTRPPSGRRIPPL